MTGGRLKRVAEFLDRNGHFVSLMGMVYRILISVN